MTYIYTISTACLAALACASSTLAQDISCATVGPNSPAALHAEWILQGWELREGDPAFVFAEEMDRFYDLESPTGVFYDNFAPKGAPTFDNALKYGANWEASVNSSRTILHALTDHNAQLVGDTVASTTLGFVGDITRLTGERITFDARSQLGWECRGGEWVIRHELNYAWAVEPEVVAPFFDQKAQR
jgi:hypothetical protein